MLWAAAIAVVVRGTNTLPTANCPGSCAVPYNVGLNNAEEILSGNYSLTCQAPENASVVYICEEPTLGAPDNCYDAGHYNWGGSVFNCSYPLLDRTPANPFISVSRVAQLQFADESKIRAIIRHVALAEYSTDRKRDVIEERVKRSLLFKHLTHPDFKVVDTFYRPPGQKKLDEEEPDPQNVPNMGSQGARAWNLALGYLMDNVETASQFLHDAIRGFQIAAEIGPYRTVALPNPSTGILYMNSGNYKWHKGTDKLQLEQFNGQYSYGRDRDGKGYMASFLEDYRGDDGADLLNFLGISVAEVPEGAPPNNALAVLAAVLDALPVHPDFWDEAVTGHKFYYDRTEVGTAAAPDVVTFGMAMVGERLGFGDELFAVMLTLKMALDGRWDKFPDNSMTGAVYKTLSLFGGGRALVDAFLTLEDNSLMLDKDTYDESFLELEDEFKNTNDPDKLDAIRMAKFIQTSIKRLGMEAMGNINYWVKAYMFIVENYKPMVDSGDCVNREFSFLANCESIHMFFNRYDYQRPPGADGYADMWTVLKNRAKLPPVYDLIDPMYNIRRVVYGQKDCASIFNEDSDYAWSSIETYLSRTDESFADRIRHQLAMKAFSRTPEVFANASSPSIHPSQFTAYGEPHYGYFERNQYAQPRYNSPYVNIDDGVESPMVEMLVAGRDAGRMRPSPPNGCPGQLLNKRVLSPRHINSQSTFFSLYVDGETQGNIYASSPQVWKNAVKFGVEKDNLDSCTAVIGKIWAFSQEQILFPTSGYYDTGNFWGAFNVEPDPDDIRIATDYRVFVETNVGGVPQTTADGPFSITGAVLLEGLASADIGAIIALVDNQVVGATTALGGLFTESVDVIDDNGRAMVTAIDNLRPQLQKRYPDGLYPDLPSLPQPLVAARAVCAGTDNEVSVEQKEAKPLKKKAAKTEKGNSPPAWAYTLIVDGIFLVLALPAAIMA